MLRLLGDSVYQMAAFISLFPSQMGRLLEGSVSKGKYGINWSHAALTISKLL